MLGCSQPNSQQKPCSFHSVNGLLFLTGQLKITSYTAFTLPLGAVPVASWSRFWSDIGGVYTAPWSKGANAIIEVETSCLKITCCNMAILPIWSLVPELACLSASSPPSSFQSSLTGRKPPSSFKSSLTGRRRRASTGLDIVLLTTVGIVGDRGDLFLRPACYLVIHACFGTPMVHARCC